MRKFYHRKQHYKPDGDTAERLNKSFCPPWCPMKKEECRYECEQQNQGAEPRDGINQENDAMIRKPALKSWRGHNDDI